MKFALGIIALFALLHGIRLSLGFDACSLLVGSNQLSGVFSFFLFGHWDGSQWLSTACVQERFTRQPLESCLQDKTVVFVGDSRMRDLYHDMASWLDPAHNLSTAASPYHSDQTHRFKRTTFQFLWRPELTPGMFAELDRDASLAVASAGLWAMKNNFSAELLQEGWQTAFQLTTTLRVPLVWMPVGAVNETLLRSDRSAITNSKIADFDNMAQQSIHVSGVERVYFLGSVISLLQASLHRTTDGVHFEPVVSRAQNTLLLNFFCGAQGAVSPGTCCAPARRPTVTQILALLTFASCGVLVLRAWATDTPPTPADSPLKTEKAPPMLHALSGIGIVMFYCFICDRTELFLREEKVFSALPFVLALLAMLVLIGWTWKPCASQGFLNRDQTDEWKGWMQLLILLYHYVDASKVLVVYVLVRVLVAAYLFQTGYGHGIYFRKNGCAELRISTILIRLNLLVVALCWVMGKPYQSYYFVPLCTFWFAVVCAVYATLSVFNANGSTLLAKIAVAAMMITAGSVVYQNHLLAEHVFGLPLLSKVFSLDGSLHEWLFRWNLDRYAVFLGMITAVVCADSGPQPLLDRAWGRAAMVALSLALAGFYIHFAAHCTDKAACNSAHSYVSLALVAAYLALRNAWPALRSKHSTAMAFCGKMSLELFLAQYHLLLANDTRALLVLLPGAPMLNAVLVFVVFLAACCQLSKALDELCSACVHNKYMRGAALLAVAITALCS